MSANPVEQPEKPQEATYFEAGTVTAGEVNATGAVNQINANLVRVKESAVFLVQSGSLEFTQGGLVLASIQQADIAESGVVVLLSDEVVLQNSSASVLFARKVKADQIKSTVFIGREVEGQVETKMSGQQALLAGLAAGAGLGLVLSFFGWLLGRKR